MAIIEILPNRSQLGRLCTLHCTVRQSDIERGEEEERKRINGWLGQSISSQRYIGSYVLSLIELVLSQRMVP